MAWVFWTFAGVRLPEFNAEADLGTPTLSPSVRTAIGSLWDPVGSGVRTLTQSHQLSLRGIYAGATVTSAEDAGLLAAVAGTLIKTTAAGGTHVVVVDNRQSIELEYERLAALLGVRGALVVRDPLSGRTRSKTARLLRVERLQRYQMATAYIEVACLFESIALQWT